MPQVNNEPLRPVAALICKAMPCQSEPIDRVTVGQSFEILEILTILRLSGARSKNAKEIEIFLGVT